MHHSKFTVLEQHLDTFGHVNNAQYLTIYEMARWNWITEGGYSIEKVQREKRGPVLLEVKMTFRKELKLRETYDVHTKASRRNEKFFDLKQEIRNKEGQVCSQADFLVGFFDLEKRKLIPPTNDWLKAIGMEKSE